MSESLDGWYQKELDFLRSTATDFSSRFPRIANRLTFSGSGIKDPHVERLIQAFAYLNARTRLKLDDSFPELVDAMLGVLYPHMMAPVPSMSIVGFKLNRSQKDLVKGHVIKRETAIESERVAGVNCQFRTCFPVTLFPLDATFTKLIPRPFSGPPSPRRNDAESVLRFEFTTLDPTKNFSAYPIESLRFHIAIPNFEKSARLLELVLSQSLEIVVNGGNEQAISVLPASCLKPVGFHDDDAVLPRKPNEFPGYRLLTEYFVLPQKYLFFDLTGLNPDILKRCGNKLEISILLDEHVPDLAQVISPDTVRLGCTPIVNLFTKTADAIPLTFRTTEVHLIPDARAQASHEIYSINDIHVDDENGTSAQFRPFYSVQHGSTEGIAGYWHAVRRPGPVERDRGDLNGPSEIYLSLVDTRFSPYSQREGALYAELTCFNRDLPESLAQQRDAARIGLDLVGGRGPVGEVKCLLPPTKTFRTHLGRENLWPMISQLSLNHLSLSDAPVALDILREILTLNDVKESEETRNLIDGFVKISTEASVLRMQNAFAKGTHIHIVMRDENFAGDSAYLFASVLCQFFAMYTSINSFTQLTASTLERQARNMKVWKWPAQAGKQQLL